MFLVRSATLDDVDAIQQLYKCVARTTKGGIAREEDEIPREYVLNNVTSALTRGGLCLVATRAPSATTTGVSVAQPMTAESTADPGWIVGEIHCYRAVPRVFSHVLGDLTVVVHPECQGHGLGRLLFDQVLGRVRSGMPDVMRVELIARESNRRAIGLYESLGFVREGRLERRIRDVDVVTSDDGILIDFYCPRLSLHLLGACDSKILGKQ
ncbi:GNAT family N-acetyltransferase [Pelomyxa schiedti]|nr:GNAT family N-acetyltransferase [Pelomyxa schiedti]